MNTENLQTLKIHKLTQAQYDRELAAGNIDENALYLTPDEKIDLSPYATIEQVNTKADTEHNHDDVYYTEAEVDTLLSGKSDISHKHDSDYDEKGSASTAVDTHNSSTSAHTDIRNSISSLQTTVSGKANSSHTHSINEVSNLQAQLDGKSDTSHTHNEYMTKADPVGSGSFSMGRLAGSTVGNCSSTLGATNTASGHYSHAEGYNTKAEGAFSHAEGGDGSATGDYSHTEGCYTHALGNYSHAEGNGVTVNGVGAHGEGYYTTAEGDYSHAEGYKITALNYQHVQGHYNKTTNATAGDSSGTSGTAFVIGNGTSDTVANAFRVTYAGKTYGIGTFGTSGADYAEFFEWQDLNPNAEDRRGYFVTLDGEKIKIAEPNDYILGIISGMPAVIGNSDEDWRGRYILDDFGAFITEEFEYEEEIFDKESGEKITVTKTGTKYKENPDYDPTLPYVQREDRPEWDAVGMIGVLSVRDDGTCQVNGFCKVAEGGIATASENGYRVIARINENIVKVVFR